MIAICVESSHVRGMGHFFRSCVLADALVEAGQRVKIYISDHPPAVERLRQRDADFETVMLDDVGSGWEAEAIARDGIKLWIYDRLVTDARSVARVQAQSIAVVTLDDCGTGAALADLHIAALSFDPDANLPGRRVVRGVDYLILNPEIERHRRVRTTLGSIIVTLGGSDTFGSTIKVMRLLSRAGLGGVVVVGPAFAHDQELAAVTTDRFQIRRNVPSLIEELSHHDLAITGGGVTPFEANASGLPCIVVANEDFEVPIGRGLASMGGAVFAGHHDRIDEAVFTRDLPLETMSRAALANVKLDGARRVVEAVLSL